MEQRQLEFFVAVAEELSFTRAASRTHAVQSTVSASIRALERDLGVELFERSSARVALSPAGRSLYPEARQALAAMDAARTAAEGGSRGLRGSLRVGTLAGLTAVDLPGLVAGFRREHPAVDLHMSIAATGSEGLLAQVRDSTLDVAFVGLTADAAPDGIAVEEIATFHPRLLVAADHPLAGRSSVQREELRGEPFVDLPVGYCNRTRSDADFRRAGLSRSVAVEVIELPAIPAYVAAGLGVALVPPLRSEPSGGVAAVALDPPAAPWTLGLAYLDRARPAPTVAALRSLLPHFVRDTERY